MALPSPVAACSGIPILLPNVPPSRLAESRADLQRVPFGLLVATGLLVDVSEVPRGAAAGCICPSCRLPLIARHGEQHAWHFAHETRGAAPEVVEGCRFSLFVAVTLMARQILSTASSVHLPLLVVREFGHHGPRRVYEETVTPARVVVADEWLPPDRCEAIRCDALLRIGTAHLALCLHHPERALPDLPADRSRLDAQRLGIVAVDLAALWAARRPGTSARDALRGLLLDQVVGKRWLHHPREDAVRRRLRAQIPALPVEQPRRAGIVPPQARPPPSSGPPTPPEPPRPVGWSPDPSRAVRSEDARAAREAIARLEQRVPVYRRFVCVSCNREWEAYDHKDQVCPGCAERIYVSPREPRPPPSAP